jgi:putative transposase
MVLRAYKYRIYPTGEQSQQLEQHFGCVRFVYNWGLGVKKHLYESEKKGIGNVELTNRMKSELKQQKPWLTTVNSQSLQMALRNLDSAYQRFFNEKKGFPKFKSKKDNKYSFQCPQHVSIDAANGTMDLPKIKQIAICLHRKFSGTIKTTTISRTAGGRYFASILVDVPAVKPVAKQPITSDKTIGIDTGIKTFLVCSNGAEYANNAYLQQSLQRLEKLQRRHMKKQRIAVVREDGSIVKTNSANREKNRIKVARLHEKISNQRLDLIHQITNKLTHDNQVGTICIEDLNIKGMVRNHKLARSLADVGIGKFYETLAYKCEWYGINLIKIGRFEPSSKTCSGCGAVKAGLKLSERKWTCESCHTEHDRDLNAAINIKKFGLKQALEQELLEVKSVECPLVDDRSAMNLKSNGTVKQKKRRSNNDQKPLHL